jgi:hypothetical protein
MRVRAIGCVDSPDDRTNPGHGGKDQIAKRTENKDVKNAVVFLEEDELEAEDSIGKRNEAPGKQSGHK